MSLLTLIQGAALKIGEKLHSALFEIFHLVRFHLQPVVEDGGELFLRTADLAKVEYHAFVVDHLIVLLLGLPKSPQPKLWGNCRAQAAWVNCAGRATSK